MTDPKEGKSLYYCFSIVWALLDFFAPAQALWEEPDGAISRHTHLDSACIDAKYTVDPSFRPFKADVIL